MTTSSNNNIKTYRHEFSKEFMADLSTFAKVHQFDDRHAYKSEWAKWAQQYNIAQAMDVEKRRLEENGYKGDIEDKMFKAGRYYFRKKSAATATATAADATAATATTAEESSVPDLPTPTAAPTHTATAATTDPELSVPDLPTHTATPATATARRPYITMSKNSIKMMDEHIRNASASSTEEFKPSSCYSDFYQTKMTSDEMTKEIGYVIEKYEKTPGAMSNITPEELTDQIMDKIKKTYKNRYYKYTSSASSSASNNALSTSATTDK